MADRQRNSLALRTHRVSRVVLPIRNFNIEGFADRNIYSKPQIRKLQNYMPRMQKSQKTHRKLVVPETAKQTQSYEIIDTNIQNIISDEDTRIILLNNMMTIIKKNKKIYDDSSQMLKKVNNPQIIKKNSTMSIIIKSKKVVCVDRSPIKNTTRYLQSSPFDKLNSTLGSNGHTQLNSSGVSPLKHINEISDQLTKFSEKRRFRQKVRKTNTNYLHTFQSPQEYDMRNTGMNIKKFNRDLQDLTYDYSSPGTSKLNIKVPEMPEKPQQIPPLQKISHQNLKNLPRWFVNHHQDPTPISPIRTVFSRRGGAILNSYKY